MVDIGFKYYKNTQQYLRLVSERDRVERNEHIMELISQTKIDDE